jgi:hypothetical protein
LTIRLPGRRIEYSVLSCRDPQGRAPVFRIGQDPGVGCRVHAARILWLLGYPEQALVRFHNTLTLAHALSHPYSL